MIGIKINQKESQRGIKDVEKFLRKAKRLGSSLTGVEFLARKRLDNPDLTNRHIVEWLKEQNRDFISLNDSDAKKLAAIFTKEVKRRMARLVSRRVKNIGRALDAIMGAALVSCMEFWVDLMRERIDTGVDANGRSVKSSADLSDDYKEYKQNKFGRTYPIGVATGQLIANLAPNSSNVKLIK